MKARDFTIGLRASTSGYNVPMSRPASGMYLPNVNLEEMVKAARWNVDYHLGAVKHFLERPGMSTLWQEDLTVEAARKPHLQADVNRFHTHLRAFFWELVATFEAMKVWVIETKGRSSRHLVELEKSAGAEASTYRNFAHRCFLVSEGVYDTESRKLIFRSLIPAIPHGCQPVIPDRLVEYRNEMHKLFESQ